MNKKRILDYTTHTPENTNRNVLSGMLDAFLKSEGGDSPTPTPSVVDEKDINFYDYDGKLLYSYTKDEFDALEEMPPNPQHEGLISQGWNWDLTDAKDYEKLDIGQMYITDDGKTRIFVDMPEVRLSPYLGICVNGSVTVDWGDGTSTDSLSGTSLTEPQTVQHTYASPGEYVITLSVDSGSFAFGGDQYYPYILRKSTTEQRKEHSYVYICAIKKVFIGNNAEISDYAFSNCRSLSSITFPNNITRIGTNSFGSCSLLSTVIIPNGNLNIGAGAFSGCNSLSTVIIPNSVINIGDSAFNECKSLTGVIIPNSVTDIGSYAFSGCYSLLNIIIPNGIRKINMSVFSNCYSLTSVIIPNSVTDIRGYAFNYCYSLPSITIPNGVTNIGEYAFYGCYGTAEFHFLSTTPPILYNYSALSNLASDYTIYVPSESVETYKTASNWSSHASKIVGE